MPEPNENLETADQSAADLVASKTPRPWPRVRVVNEWPPVEVARAGLILIGLGVGGYLLWRVQEVLFLLLLAILLATAIEPLVNRSRRGPFRAPRRFRVEQHKILLGYH